MKRLLLFLMALAILFSVSLPGCSTSNGPGGSNGTTNGNQEEAVASFSVTKLSISATEVHLNDSVTISIDVKNTGTASGNYDVILNINNSRDSSKTVSLSPNQTQTITFNVIKQSIGTYNVAVEGLSGLFRVVPTLFLQIMSVTSPIGPGYDATLRAETEPYADCTITVYYLSGPSSAAGLIDKKADTNGNVTWTWKVGTRTTAGSWRIVVTATLNGVTVVQETYFTVL